MIGIVLVSHSKALAVAIRELVLQMVGQDFPVVVAAGVGDDHLEIGTDAVHIAEVLQPFCDGDGAVVLMDLGSAVLSAQTALELLDAEGVADIADKIRLCPAPIVEAAVAAAVQAKAGATLDAVADEARMALAAKEAQLGIEDSAPAIPAPTGGEPARTLDIVIENPHGLHARPAANLVQLVSRFQSDIRLTNLTSGRGPTSARSLTGVGLLQARKGDMVRFSVQGFDEETALQRLRELAATRFGEGEDTIPVARSAETRPDVPPSGGAAGVAASEGIAIGRPLRLAAALTEPADYPPGTPDDERRRLDDALRRVADEIGHSATDGGDAAKIFAAQALMLSDPILVEAAHARIAQGQVSALAAWRAESASVAGSYAAMEDEYLRARAADLRDIAVRVARVLAGETQTTKISPNPPAILLTDELLPSEAMACDPQTVLGVLARAGSPTAHAAIIMRTLGIPMVVGAKSIDPEALAAVSVLAIDGATGEVWADPESVVLSEIERRRGAALAERAAFEKARHDPAVTLDGCGVEVLANVGNAADATAARENGAEGVGLLRTEFLYLTRTEMPTEDQQTQALAAVLANLGPGPVVIRTPDIGADKPLAFMASAEEHNPFLGVRGLRLSFRHPGFFASNLRAILRAGLETDVWIMFPMVTSPEEMSQARDFAETAHRDLEKGGVPHRWPVKLGMMVEVPAAALMAERFARQADFFSIGTNDLTQYILAAERGNGDLESLQDAVHPAVLRAIRAICDRASEACCHLSVCGDAASDPLAAALLIGSGVRSLSVRPNQVAAIKAQIRRVSTVTLRELADKARQCDNSVEVRQLAREVLADRLHQIP
ncbi:phosphoenolpyruvate--protein phosphotransferase [Telmatospirillum sp.]|uniref:phosphoenolpyruvate--protein phosphotransferase n=1 Tax=Telmatospirillum sp. TaxID=2079197 RepID=UPI00284D3BFB|nr:phosphoenolpyruvate--protein phosphotransferase [Telmatospirillum sp.]MDR3436743.1 phosphoenolpyruvate--protein phosphotransferase [Telmatospirillum sp.]